jgi:hypothetical protein
MKAEDDEPVKNVLRQRMFVPGSEVDHMRKKDHASANGESKCAVPTPDEQEILHNAEIVHRQVLGVDGVRWVKRRLFVTASGLFFGLDPTGDVGVVVGFH